METDVCLDSRELAADYGSAWSAAFSLSDSLEVFTLPTFTIYRGDEAVVIANELNGKISQIEGETNAFTVSLPDIDLEIEPGYYSYSFVVTRQRDFVFQPFTAATGRFRVEYAAPPAMMGLRSPLYTLNRRDVEVKAGRTLSLGVAFDGPSPSGVTDTLEVYSPGSERTAYTSPVEGSESWISIPDTDTADMAPGRYYYRRRITYSSRTVTVAKGILWVRPGVPA